jgi:hypothetical protein
MVPNDFTSRLYCQQMLVEITCNYTNSASGMNDNYVVVVLHYQYVRRSDILTGADIKIILISLM